MWEEIEHADSDQSTVQSIALVVGPKLDCSAFNFQDLSI
jgi:hypothetical protein